MAKKDNLKGLKWIGLLIIVWGFYYIFQVLIWIYNENFLIFSLISLFFIFSIVSIYFAQPIWKESTWFSTQITHGLQKHRWKSIQKIEDMQKLHWRDFEKFIEFVLQKRWFKTKIGPGRRDGGIDIHANFEGRKYLVQCKKWNKYKVTEPGIREFYWAINDFDPDAKGIFVTTSHLTSDAKFFSKRNDIEIWDKNNLEKYIEEYMGAKGAEINENKSEIIQFQDTIQENKSEIIQLCTKCGGHMIIRTAKHWENKWNQFLGCGNFPKCKNIVNL